MPRPKPQASASGMGQMLLLCELHELVNTVLDRAVLSTMAINRTQ